MTRLSDYPHDLFYGNQPLDIRFKSGRGGHRQYFCLNNRTLHLAEKDFDDGTYEAGSLLGALCREFCAPARSSDQKQMPCPAFVSAHNVGTKSYGLASVEARPYVEWEKCAGVRALLEMTETPEESFFLLSYLKDKGGDESRWRTELVDEWNTCWSRISASFGAASRLAKFDQIMWWTMRFPALIPQVWLNWLYSASEEEQKQLESNPSRVDFAAFWAGERHIIEIDGPSHYASWDDKSRTYLVDEKAYARNLKIARSLGADDWKLTRLARIEIRNVMESDCPEWDAFSCLGVLPFYEQDYMDQWTLGNLDWVGLAPQFVPAGDIPF